VGRRKPFWAEGRAGPRARKERREGEKRGRGLGRSFLFLKYSFFKLSKVLNSFKTFSYFKLFSKNFKSVLKKLLKLHANKQ
jgi:hypothetical protein